MEKLALSRKEAAELSNVSLPTLDLWLNREENRLPSIRAGRKVLISTAMLKEWLNAESERQKNA